MMPHFLNTLITILVIQRLLAKGWPLSSALLVGGLSGMAIGVISHIFLRSLLRSFYLLTF